MKSKIFFMGNYVGEKEISDKSPIAQLAGGKFGPMIKSLRKMKKDLEKLGCKVGIEINRED